MKKILRIIIIIIATVLLFQATTLPVGAVRDTIFYSGNNITMYDPDAADCSSGQTPIISSVTVSKTDTTTAIYQYLTKTSLTINEGRPLSVIQASGVMANMYADSNFDPAHVEQAGDEKMGAGLLNWSYSRFDALKAFAEQDSKDWKDLDVQLAFLKSEIEESEQLILGDYQFRSTDSPAVAAERFRVIFLEVLSTADTDTSYQKAAVSIYNQYSGRSSLTSGCVVDNGVVAGNLVQTAINFALETPIKVDGIKINKADARSTYQVAKPKYNSAPDWTDCGGYVATVMIAAEIDTSYPTVLVSTQLAYVRAHPEKYEVIEGASLSDLRPGDILFVSNETYGHTTIYTGKSTYPSVDASLHERVPGVRDSFSAQWMITNGGIVARVIK